MGRSLPRQLTLGVGLDDDATFANFHSGQANRQVVTGLLQPAPAVRCIYLWGPRGSGRTHLLQALCHECAGPGNSSIYLPLKERGAFPPAILEGVGVLGLVCIDDLDAVAGDDAWEAALFGAFNAISESGGRLVLASGQAPRRLPLGMADLRSRLQSALVCQISPLDDHGKIEVLRLRAANRGIELPLNVAEYIVRRSGRDLPSLIAVLNRIDENSLRRQRRLTIPLVKSTLAW